MTEATDGLELIEPPTRTVRFAGRDLAIRPLTVGQLPGVMRALQGIDLAQGVDIAALPDLIAEHGEQIIWAVAIATRLAREDLEEAELDEFARLVTAMIEVNSDFFVRRVVPALTGALPVTTPLPTPGTGPTPSSS